MRLVVNQNDCCRCLACAGLFNDMPECAFDGADVPEWATEAVREEFPTLAKSCPSGAIRLEEE